MYYHLRLEKFCYCFCQLLSMNRVIFKNFTDPKIASFPPQLMESYCTKQRVFWFTVLFISLSFAMYQILKMIQSWKDRPFDLVEERMPKHNVMFPSVTICPEGSTLWPALEVLLAKQQLQAEKFPKAFSAYCRIKLRRIDAYYTSTALDSKYYKMGCEQKTSKLGVYCQFMKKVFSYLDIKIEKGSLYEETKTLYQELEFTGNMFSHIETETNLGAKSSRKPYTIYEKYWAMINNNPLPKYNWKMVMVYLHLQLLKAIEWKSNNQDGSDVMKQFLYLLEIDSTQNITVKTCSTLVAPIPVTGFKPNPPNELPLKLPPLHYYINKNSMNETLAKWKPLFINVDYKHSNNKLYLNCVKEDYYKFMYSVYISLIYVQSLNFQENLANYIVNLMRYNAQFDLPLQTIIGYNIEIDKELKYSLENILSIKNVPWNIKDAMDMAITNGLYTIHRKASWKTKLIKRNRGITEIITMRNNKRTSNALQRKKMIRLSDPDEFPIPSKYWTSLSEKNSDCLLSIQPETDLSRICKTHKNCTEFCHHLDTVMNKSLVVKWYEILEQVNHPSRFQESTDKSRALTWLLPFCFSKKELYNKFDQLKQRRNYNFTEDNYYGYEFCRDAKQMYTDTGICTTFNFPDYSDFMERSASVFFQRGPNNSTQSWVPLYPGKAIAEMFEDGILLILDSWAFDNYYTYIQDEDLGFSKRGTPLESIELNNFKVVLHDKNEVPMIFDHENTILSLNHPATMQEYLLSVKSYQSKIDAEIDDADDDVKSQSLHKRQCKFPEEKKGLVFFKKYSEKNCLFECKLQVARKICQCVPWNFPRQDSDKLCGLFGNICFQREFVRLKRDISTGKDNLGTPPCECYPDCKKIKYVFAEERPAYSENNFNWLDMNIPLVTLGSMADSERHNSTIWDTLVGNYKAKQFLYKYIMDVFRDNDSLLNPGRDSLTELDVGKIVSYPAVAKKVVWEGRARNLVLLFIDFSKQTYKKKKLVLRVTFADMLSSLGGTLGLFTGFSIIALVDVMFWAFDIVKGFLKLPKSNRRR